MFLRWGRFSYRHRRLVPVIVVALIAALYLACGLHLDERMSQEGWEDPGADSTTGAAIEQQTFGRDNRGDVIALYRGTPERLDDPLVARAIQGNLEALRTDNDAHVAHVTSYFEQHTRQLRSEDGTLAFAAIGLRGDGEQTLKDFRAIEDTLRGQPLPAGIELDVAGATAVADALDKGMAGDVRRAELYALPAVAVLLLLVFGSVVAAAMPLIVGILSILGSLGVLALLAQFTQVNVFAQSVVTLLGLGLAIDYGLFMVSRFREELDAGQPVPRAVATTTATAGKTVVFSAGMVAAALSGLMLFPQAFLKSVAYGAMSAVGLAALLSVTVLPALFGLLGHRIDLWTLRRGAARRARRLEDTIWWRLPSWAMRHAKTVTVGLAALLIALALPLTGITFGGINETYLPPDDPTRAAQAEFDEAFPQLRTEPVKLVVTGASNEQLVQIYQQTAGIEGLTGRFSPSQPTKDGTTVLSAGIADRAHNSEVIAALRQLDIPDGVHAYIAGTPAMEIESIEALMSTLPWMGLYIIAVTFLLMALVFGSLVLPAKAVIMTLIGLGATLGILTAMFVDGLGAGALNFSAGPLMSPVLVLIVAIVYGLSTDYEVFLVSRMVEARDRGASTDDAIRAGTAHTGSIITAAALIMIVVSGAFGFSHIVMMKYIAFGMMAALLLDATVIRMALVPAVMHLLRDDNWWAPSWVRRAADALGHGHAPTRPAAARPEGSAAVPTVPVDQARVIAETEAARGNRTTSTDETLIPFRQLVQQLEDPRHE